MAKPPRKPGPIARATRATVAHVPGPCHRAAPGRRPAPDLFRPAFIEPCKPVLRERLPTGLLWRYEVKHDGYRIQAHSHEGEVRIYTRRGLDWTDRMPVTRDAVAALGRDMILDGEAAIVGEDGIAEFFTLHAALAGRHAPDAFLFAFDLLRLDGADLRAKPLAKRQAALAVVLAGSNDYGLEPVDSVEGDPAAVIRAACGMGLEGIVAKRLDRPYRSGEREDWVKVRCTQIEHLAVMGFEPSGRRGVASLKVCRLVEDQLVPCGWVGSGIGDATSRALRAALDVGRHVVVEVEHRGHTPAGELRHPVFKGWSVEE